MNSLILSPPVSLGALDSKRAFSRSTAAVLADPVSVRSRYAFKRDLLNRSIDHRTVRPVQGPQQPRDRPRYTARPHRLERRTDGSGSQECHRRIATSNEVSGFRLLEKAPSWASPSTRSTRVRRYQKRSGKCQLIFLLILLIVGCLIVIAYKPSFASGASSATSPSLPTENSDGDRIANEEEIAQKLTEELDGRRRWIKG